MRRSLSNATQRGGRPSHHARLIEMLKQVAPAGEVESLSAEPVRASKSVRRIKTRDQDVENAAKGLRAVAESRALTDDQVLGLEAIVLPKYRPVIDIVNDDFNRPPAPWTHLGNGAAKQRIRAAIPSIGRVEVPDHPRLPFAGTGFVVGRDLLLTNRHVAEVFATGLGRRNLAFRGSQQAGIDFAQEIAPRAPVFLRVVAILLIHPHWDMALLKVDGLGEAHPPLTLAVEHPDDLLGREVAVIGYPAQDPRNDLNLQFEVFRGVFDVKRLQPGKLKTRELILDHFGNRVRTLTHDSSTLGGNSGSALVDLSSGEVVGLHFGGVYLKANYAVPTYELARDRRVVEAGLSFKGAVESTDEWEDKWRSTESGELVRPPQHSGSVIVSRQPAPNAPPIAGKGSTATWTIPLEVSVSFGTPALSVGTVAPQPAIGATPAVEIPLQIPIIHDHLELRTGYQADFLELHDGEVVPMPELTAAGEGIAATLDDGSTELRYHKFSIVMHKTRRLALFTASNVDWRESRRRVNGHDPSRRELTGVPEGFAEQWVTDPRIPEDHQLPDVFFTRDRAAFDKGHLVRRDDVCWGDTFDDIQKANGDTYHTTNCSPQVKGFNQATQGEDNWGDLEDLVEDETGAEKCIVFAGPVFNPSDPEFKGRDTHGIVRVLIPQKYWKIIVVKGDAGPEAYGFVLEQNLGGVDWEFAVPQRWEPHTASIAEIETLLDEKVSLDALAQFDQIESPHGRRLAEAVQSSS